MRFDTTFVFLLIAFSNNLSLITSDWQEFTDTGSGRKYYYNTETKETTWEKPASMKTTKIVEEDTWTTHIDDSTGNTYYYNSKTGNTSWEDPRLDKIIDPCATSPCKNGGRCTKQGSLYKCDCISGFTGENCTETELKTQIEKRKPPKQENIDLCTPNPCKQGVCKNENKDYMCRCTPGWEGKNCAKAMGPCSSSPCKNEGICIAKKNGDYYCKCHPGWTGETCDVDIDECESSPCNNGASCENLMGGRFHCECKTGFSGILCDHDLDIHCGNNKCENGSKCIDEVAKYSCECTKGFTGLLCGTEIDECLEHECKNKAKCVDGIAEYTCECRNGFDGQFCEHNIDCLSNPCQHGGKCIDKKASFKCMCNDDYSGPLCEINIDNCTAICSNRVKIVSQWNKAISEIPAMHKMICESLEGCAWNETELSCKDRNSCENLTKIGQSGCLAEPGCHWREPIIVNEIPEDENIQEEIEENENVSLDLDAIKTSTLTNLNAG
eukprot:GSMAST32.ASY1.ANO1.2110.1 assembled CDS